MKVPSLRAFGGFVQPKNRQYSKMQMCCPPILRNNLRQRSDSINFSSISSYLKKYKSLPDEVKDGLDPENGIAMLKDMEYVEQGKIRRRSIGQSSNARVYKSPYLKDHYFIITSKNNSSNQDSQIIYSRTCIGDSVWSDGNIQILRKN